jgi:hypothetical protein
MAQVIEHLPSRCEALIKPKPQYVEERKEGREGGKERYFGQTDL